MPEKRTAWKVVSSNRDSISVGYSSTYSINYSKGEIVKAKEGSVGIFCFKYYRDAQNFASFFGYSQILKVRPIGRGWKIQTICSMPINSRGKDRYLTRFGKIVKRLKEKKKGVCTKNVRAEVRKSRLFVTQWPAPPGTVTYPAVEVLT